MSQPRTPRIRLLWPLLLAWPIGLLAWDLWPPRTHRVIEPAQIQADQGAAYRAPTFQSSVFLRGNGDTSAHPEQSSLELFEGLTPLRPPHTIHARIREDGGGAFSHWGDAVYFSSTDGTDPRVNGRTYRFARTLRPALWIHGLTWSALALLILIRLRRAIRNVSRQRWQSFVAAVFGSGTIILASATAIALSTRTGYLHEVSKIPGSNLLTRSAAAYLPASEQSTDGQHITVYDWFGSSFEWVIAPFTEILIPSTGDESGSYLGMTHRGQPLERVHSIAELAGALPADTSSPGTLPDRRSAFLYRAGSFLIVGLPDDPDSVELIAPIGVTTSGIALLSILLVSLLVCYLLRERIAERRLTQLLLAPPLTLLFMLGLATTIANCTGLLLPLRSPAIEPGEAYGGFGPRDVTVPWKDARERLRRQPGESASKFAQRATLLISDSIAHTWPVDRADELRIHVPVWENWILWLAGDLRSSCRAYEFQDPWRAAERGVGMCSQATLALVGLLAGDGLDARPVGLDGHVVTALYLDTGEQMVLDPDYGVVFRISIDDLPEFPAEIREAYTARLTQLGLSNQAAVVDRVVDIYVTQPNVVSPPPETRTAAAGLESIAYSLKWPIPLVLLLPGLGAVFVARRRRHRPTDTDGRSSPGEAHAGTDPVHA